MNANHEENNVSIECAPNGPLIVRNLTSLKNSKGQSIASKDVMALCRCGQSANKPFCDGTHATIDLSDEKRTDGALDNRDSYVGKHITVHDNRGICSHASFCADNLESVFNAEREPWVDPDAGTVQTIIDVIQTCPSGALSYSIGGVEYRDQQRNPSVTVSKDGPYFVVGGIELGNAAWGKEASKEHYALCRCGQSKNAPFCDGTHRNVNFHDDKN